MEIDFIMIYLTSFLRILLNNVKKVIVVTAAARISLTGSARKTANTLFEKKFGSRKISGIRLSLLINARSAEGFDLLYVFLYYNILIYITHFFIL